MEYPKDGFARMWFKFSRTPYFLYDALTYAPRRRNVIWKIIESLLGLLVVWYFRAWWAIPVGLAAEFLVYEYVAEPLGWTGPYWERGPRSEQESPDGDMWWSE